MGAKLVAETSRNTLKMGTKLVAETSPNTLKMGTKLVVEPRETHPENGDEFSCRNVGKPSHLGAVVCPRNVH